MTDEKTCTPVQAAKLAVALHEAAHVVALRHYANAAAFVTMTGWDKGHGLTGMGTTTGMKEITNTEEYTMILAALIVTENVDDLAPGIVTPVGDWAYVTLAMRMKPDQIRASRKWKSLSQWVEAHEAEIAAVAQDIMEGREMFELT